MKFLVSISASIVLGLIIYMVLIQIFYEKLILEKKVSKQLENQKVLVSKDIEEFTENNITSRKLKKKSRFAKRLARAGIKIGVGKFLSVVGFLGILILLLGIFMEIGILFIAILEVFWLLFVTIFLNMRIKKRRMMFNKQLPEFITLIISSLKVGHSFTQAIKTASASATSPIKDEFDILIKTLNYGVSLKDALEDMYTRVESEELAIMNHAIIIQKEIGGNIIHMLEIIHKTIKDREALNRKIATLTAQGRMSGVVIGTLPIVLCIVIMLISPDYIMPLFTTIYGRVGLGIGVVMEIIGLLVIKRIVEIEV